MDSRYTQIVKLSIETAELRDTIRSLQTENTNLRAEAEVKIKEIKVALMTKEMHNGFVHTRYTAILPSVASHLCLICR